MAEPVITTTALLIGTTKAAIAMAPAIAVISIATYGSMKVLQVIDDKIEARRRKRREAELPKALNRYQRYLLAKQQGMTNAEAWKAAEALIDELLELTKDSNQKVTDMLKAGVQVPVPLATTNGIGV